MNQTLIQAGQKLISLGIADTVDPAALKLVVRDLSALAGVTVDGRVDVTPSGQVNYFQLPAGMQTGRKDVRPDLNLVPYVQGYVYGPVFPWFEATTKQIYNDAYARQLINDPLSFQFISGLWYRPDFTEDQLKELTRKLFAIDEVHDLWKDDPKYAEALQHAN